MFNTKKTKSLNDFIKTKIDNNDKELFFDIQEIQLKEQSEPSFELYFHDQNKKNIIHFLPHVVYDNQIVRVGNNLEEISGFINNIQYAHKDFNIKYKIQALMPQYQNMLNQELENHLLFISRKMHSTWIIKDIDETKIELLTFKEQKNFFNDFCLSGNASSLKKILDFSIISNNGKAYNLTENDFFTSTDIIGGLEQATLRGNLNIVKTIFENENALKIMDLTNNNLASVLSLACAKENKEIISYILDKKQYKLNNSETKILEHELIHLGFNNIEKYRTHEKTITKKI